MGKEIVYMGKTPDFGISQSSGLVNESSVNNQSASVPEAGVIFDVTMGNDSDRTAIVDSSNCQPETKPVMTPVDLVRQAREEGFFTTLPVRQRMALDYLFPEEGKPLNLRETGKQMGHTTKESVRKLKRKRTKDLKMP
ncbi:MAG: hypothetical protein AAB675_02785 [Patescibacteria group bacterium]